MAASDNFLEIVWANLFPQAWVLLIAQVEVYLENFIVIIQGVQEKWKHMTRHPLNSIDILYRPNNNKYRVIHALI